MAAAKGTVYGGVLYLPHHPYADIHGLVRAVMRTKSWAYVNMALEQLGVVNPSLLVRNGIWALSGSAVEKIVTEHQYGCLLVCPLVEAYINAEKYLKLSRADWVDPKRNDPIEKSTGQPASSIQQQTSGVHAGGVNRQGYPKAYTP